MDFLCGVALTLLLESIILILATEHIRRKIHERRNL